MNSFSGPDEKKGSEKSFDKQEMSQKSSSKPSDIEKQLVNDTSENEQDMFDRAVALSLESFKEEMNAKEEVSITIFHIMIKTKY